MLTLLTEQAHIGRIQRLLLQVIGSYLAAWRVVELEQMRCLLRFLTAQAQRLLVLATLMTLILCLVLANGFSLCGVFK